MKLYVYAGVGGDCDRAEALIEGTGLACEVIELKGVGDMNRAGVTRTPTLVLESCDEMLAFAMEVAASQQPDNGFTGTLF